MQTSVTFKNIDPSDPLKSYVQEKLDRLDKLLDNPAEANVVLRVEKFRHIAEVNINGDRLNIIGKEETEDMYSAIDMVLDKLEKQIKKNKEKNRDHRNRQRGGDVLGDLLMEEEPPGRISVKLIDYKPMDVEEAVLQLGLVDDNFLVFTNSKTEKVNVVYRRSKGNFGLIQPSN